MPERCFKWWDGLKDLAIVANIDENPTAIKLEGQLHMMETSDQKYYESFHK